MNRLLTLAAALLLVFGNGMAKKNYEPLPPELDGTMMPYVFEAGTSTPVWNDSLRPVKIVYVARHGARYLSSAKKTDELVRRLTDARNRGTITRDGEDFMQLLDNVREKSQGRWGHLSEVGIMEEQRLGKEMADLCPDLVRDARVKGVATYVPRVVMTMYEFCHSLAVASSDAEITASDGKRYSPLLRFFDTDSVYKAYLKHGAWGAAYDSFVEKNIPVEPAVRILGKENGLTPSQLRKVTMEMYGVLQGMRASGAGEPTTRWMSVEEYRACWRADNLDHYLKRSGNTLSTLAPESAAPLLKAMIADILSTGDADVNLYFGHAETVMPLFSLMGLPGCDAPDAGAETPDAVWRDWEVSPLGANLLTVVLEAPSGQLYAAVRLNGRFIAPLPGNSSTVVSLTPLLTHWLDRAAHYD